jgi:hypothetical protein
VLTEEEYIRSIVARLSGIDGDGRHLVLRLVRICCLPLDDVLLSPGQQQLGSFRHRRSLFEHTDIA